MYVALSCIHPIRLPSSLPASHTPAPYHTCTPNSTYRPLLTTDHSRATTRTQSLRHLVPSSPFPAAVRPDPRLRSVRVPLVPLPLVARPPQPLAPSPHRPRVSHHPSQIAASPASSSSCCHCHGFHRSCTDLVSLLACLVRLTATLDRFVQSHLARSGTHLTGVHLGHQFARRHS